MSFSDNPALRVPVEQGVPHTRVFDSTLKLLSEGYPFFQRRCAELDTDAFATRLMGRRAICVSGHEASRMFWQPGRFTRRGAIPPTTLMLLQGDGFDLVAQGGGDYLTGHRCPGEAMTVDLVKAACRNWVPAFAGTTGQH